MYQQDLALNNLYSIKPNQTKNKQADNKNNDLYLGKCVLDIFHD